MMMIAGLFDCLEAAERARLAVSSGLPRSRAYVSRILTEDGVAAEVPGQAYENQTTEDPDCARFVEAVLGAVCVVSVKIGSRREAAVVAELLRSHGARGGILRVPRALEA